MIKILSTRTTPLIKIDFDNNIFAIKGNTYGIYNQDISRLNIFLENIEFFLNKEKENIKFDLFLNYIPSRFKPILISIFKKILDLEKMGYKYEVNWYLDEEDEDMVDLHDSIIEIIDIKINKIITNLNEINSIDW